MSTGHGWVSMTPALVLTRRVLLSTSHGFVLPDRATSSPDHARCRQDHARCDPGTTRISTKHGQVRICHTMVPTRHGQVLTRPCRLPTRPCQVLTGPSQAASQNAWVSLTFWNRRIKVGASMKSPSSKTRSTCI